jgi:hypothetical protein
MSLLRSSSVSTIRSRAALAGALALTVAACDRPGTEPAAARDTPDAAAGGAAGGTMLASSASLLGRWQKPEQTLPPITLELRADAADRVTGRVWLSGVTYDAPVTLGDSSFVLGADRPTMRGALTADGRLRVRLLDAQGATQLEAVLVRAQ